jgi:hypothetical protein
MDTNLDYQTILNNWDFVKEQQKADFLDHMYKCAGRQNKDHPMHGLYTGLWQDFCIQEAGPIMRNQYFEMLEAVRQFEEMQQKQQTAA